MKKFNLFLILSSISLLIFLSISNAQIVTIKGTDLVKNTPKIINDNFKYLDDKTSSITCDPATGTCTIGTTVLDPATSNASWRKYTVAYTNAAFVGAATTVTAAVFTLPANGVIQGVRLKHSVAFAGTAVSAVSCSLGDGTDATAYSPAFNVFQAVGATVQLWDGGAYSTTAAQQTVTLSCTANTNFGAAGVTALTAGSLDVHVFWAVLP